MTNSFLNISESRSASTNTSTNVHFVDLGLPSCTLWADRDVDVRPLSEESLPSYEQARELVEHCNIVFGTNSEGRFLCRVQGPNGNHIDFPVEDYEGTPGPSACCWCRSGVSEEYGRFLILSEYVITIGIGLRSLGYPYRIVI